MIDLLQIKSLCQKYGIYPAKSRGQNFLFEQEIIDKIIKLAGIKKDEVILEVGPGLGVLTGELVKNSKKVIAVELDKKILEFLAAEYADEISAGRLTVASGDILKFNPVDYNLKNYNYRIVANLPYNITAVFLRRFLEQPTKPSEMILMVQKEVAQRLTARPGEMSLLSVSVQFYSEPEILFYVDKNCFWPIPQVDSAVIKLKLKTTLPEIDIKSFFRVAKIGFSAKRKQLQNNLAAGFHQENDKIKQILADLGLAEKVRAQDLSIEDWVKLTNKLSDF